MSMVILEDAEGFYFYRPEQIAAITPEFGGRFRVVAKDGVCATCPTAPAGGPWVRLGPSLVNPKLLKKVAGGYQDPAGFVHSGQLGGKWVDPKPLDCGGALDCDPDAVQQLVGQGENGLGCVWITDEGRFEWDVSAVQASREHPCLVQLRRGHFLNLRRFRRILRGRDVSTLILDTGDQFEFYNTKTARLLATRLGLPHLRHLEPRNEALHRFELRDWPFELAKAKSKVLREHFRDARVLIANLVWQVVRYRQQGVAADYGTDYRDFWYDPLISTLYRAGFLKRPLMKAFLAEGTSDELFQVYQQVVGQMVGDDRLFTFADLGFADSSAALRKRGARRPRIVIVAEKLSLNGDLERLAEEFGVSYVVVGGVPSLVATEFFARAFDDLGELILIAFVDFDVGGWVVADSFATQLRRFHGKYSHLLHLIRPECFTAEELELYALPCPSGTPALRTKAKNWVKRSGGIGGQALGMHANKLKPYERVRARFMEVCKPFLQD